ncbi:trehalase [Zychaea mexicana]|uniref:trehalase n=1 Tax=Zychaea mexicana TaxID=64656 RepID=UPI0022FDCD0E|nr:trehalase [Zychaea mexicana]KAI9494172.1 trehalase [Zychaea mexicana]
MPNLNSVLLLLSTAVLLTLRAAAQDNGDVSYPERCDSPIYCEGPLLRIVQLASLYPDSKTFVDKPTSRPVDQVLAAFEELGENPSDDAIRSFVDDNFLEEGTEVRPVNYTIDNNIPLLGKIDDESYRGWATQVHQYWAKLTFEFDTSFLCEGCATSTLPVKRPFVVPGGRFREFYYWDSYFVIRGLLLSELHDVAKDMLLNFLDYIEEYGFIPNGARIYYLNRSQPPFLVEMVKAYYNATGDDDFLKEALPTLDKEYEFWMKNKSIHVDGHVLNHYNVINEAPRPESYREDYETATLADFSSPEHIPALYADLSTGAESGYDFTSRWTKSKVNNPNDPLEILRSLSTRNIVPIDLNALLWGMESTLAEWHTQCDGASKRKAKYYKRQAAKRLEALEHIFWDEEDAAFYDYNVTSNALDKDFTPACLYPFWLGAVPSKIKRSPKTLSRVFDKTRELLEEYPGILTTSVYNTTLQWDLPNGWPPLQYIAMKAMLNVDSWLKQPDNGLVGLAYTLAERYIASAFCSWYKTGGAVPGVLQQLSNQTDNGHMFEKFDVEEIGDAGGGGEYVVQAGFGWTNGIALWVFDTFTGLVAPDCMDPTDLVFPV